MGIGNISRKVRYLVCRNLLKECGKNVNIERKAMIFSGSQIRIGDNSGLGANSIIGGPIIIGENVMMGPNVSIFRTTKSFDRTDIPIRQQGYRKKNLLIICNDVWIGRDVIILPGCCLVGKGAIIGARAVVTRNVPDYSITAGNPANIHKLRILTHNPIGEIKLTLPSAAVKNTAELAQNDNYPCHDDLEWLWNLIFFRKKKWFPIHGLIGLYKLEEAK
jgi:maltose O-acetyltransferase